MAIPDVDDADQLMLRLRAFAAKLIDVYQDCNVSEPEAAGYIGDQQFMQTVGSLMSQNELKFITYIVEKKDG